MSYTAFGEPVYQTLGSGNTVVWQVGGPLPAGLPRYGYCGGYGYESGLITLDGSPESGLPPITLLHLGARWYDPAIGRFVQRDPIGIIAGLNSYTYCDNGPINRVDPRGREGSMVGVATTSAIQGALAGAIGGGVGSLINPGGPTAGGVVSGIVVGTLVGATGGWAAHALKTGWGAYATVAGAGATANGFAAWLNGGNGKDIGVGIVVGGLGGFVSGYGASNELDDFLIHLFMGDLDMAALTNILQWCL